MSGRGYDGILFVQAEDGIRDLVRSRGLGDVYKRQVVEEAMADHWGHIPTEFDEWITRRRGYGIEPSLWLSLIHI